MHRNKTQDVAMTKNDNEKAKKPAEKPISLHPLDFKQAVSGLLKVNGDDVRADENAKESS